MDAHAMNIIQGRQFHGFPLPTGLPISLPIPLPTGKPGDSSSSSSSSTSASSASLSTSSSAPSSSSSSSTSASPSSSATSSDLTTPTTSDIVLSTPSFSTSPLSTSTQTVTAFPDSPTTTPSATASPSHTSFLQNKVLSGVVFAIVGIIGFAILIMFATFALRRRRNKRLIEDAVSFDPVNMGTGTGYPGALETGQVNRASSSTGDQSNWSNGPEVRNTLAFTDYAPSARSYLPPSANLAYSYAQQGPYNNNQQPYAQSFNWGASAQQPHVNPYGLSTVEEVDQSRRSRSSSSEIKFAPTAVPPPRQLGR